MTGELRVLVASASEPSGALSSSPIGCDRNQFTLCLLDGRYRASLSFDAGDARDSARATTLSADGGYFWFFRPDNPEVLVKILDGCNINDRHWVFFTPATDVPFTLRIEDSWTGESELYDFDGASAEAVRDTRAFESCEG